MASIKITDLAGKEVTGRCVFQFGGFTVSASTVFPHASDRVLVMNRKGDDLFSCFTVEEAVEWISKAREVTA